MKIEVSDEELKDMVVRVCRLGESLGYTPDEFAIRLSMVAKYLMDAQGIEIHAERKLDA